MKTTTCRLLTLVAALLVLPALTLAQTTAVPDQISYQGVVTDAGGTPVGNSAPENRTVVFRVWDHATNSAVGNLIYSEQQVVTISKGEFSVLVGDGTVVTGTPLGFSETAKGKPTVTIPTAFGGTTRYLGVSVYDSGGAVAPEISPRQRVVSSAFAYRAKFAESVGSNGTTAITTLNDGKVGVGTATPASLFTITGANTSTTTNTPQMMITDDGDPNERLLFGLNSTGNGTGFIQATKVGTGAQNLLLNPNGGNVGINLTNPQNTLHVNGIISARPSNTTHGYVALQPGDAGNDGYIEWLKPGGGRSAHLGYSGTSNLQLTLSGSNHFLVNGNGNVGIGTAPTPTARLEVGGGIASTAGATSHAQGAHLEWNKTGEGAVWLLNQRGLGGGGIIFGDVTTGDVVTERMRVDGSGKVGIGTVTPNHRLQVHGNLMVGTGAPNLSFTPIGDTLYLGQPRKFLSTTLGSAVGGSVDWLNLMCHNGSAGILFGGATTDATPHSNPDVYMVIKPSGSVGIGTANPKGMLHVTGDIYAKGHVQLHAYEGDGVSGTAYLQARDSTTTSNINLILRTKAGPDMVEVLTCTSGGNVGIGKSPEDRLHVRGTIRVEHPSNSNHYQIFVDGSNSLLFKCNLNGGNYAYLNHTTLGLISTSDQRAKKDIEPMQDCLSRLMKLTPSTFRYNHAKAGSPLNYGFIAQDVEKQFPDIVEEKEGLKRLAGASFEGINARAIQELKQEKDAEVKALQDENAALKARLAAIERLLLANDKPAALPVSLRKDGGGAE